MGWVDRVTIHPRSRITSAALSEVETELIRIRTKYGLTFAEYVRIVSEVIRTDAVYMVRGEREAGESNPTG